jgi:anaerobic dimethyl sulfoxide reductase subunit B (iron-sulfur subunit)
VRDNPMQLGFYVDQSRCTGCHTCVVACKDWNDLPAGPVNWRWVSSVEEGVFPKVFVGYVSLSRACIAKSRHAFGLAL